jgi:hypothetical protein
MILYEDGLVNFDFYKNKGWVHIKNFINIDIVSELRKRALKLSEWVIDKEGKPSKYGSPFHWRGLGCAGMYDDYLMEFYKDKSMYQLSSKLLESSDVWLYNDQVVVKFPNDGFGFEAHTDNTAGETKNKGKNTVNLCVILDDFTDENGTLEVFNKDDGQQLKLYPKAGDIVAIHGDTLHQSEPNRSNSPRCLYACVYSSEKIEFQNYYKTKFLID